MPEFLKKLKITTAMSVMIGSLFVLSFLIVGVIISFVISGKINSDAVRLQNSNIRVAAGMFEEIFPGTSIGWNSDGSVDRVMLPAFPEFKDNLVVDKIGKLTGEIVTIFEWDDSRNDFVRRATNVIQDNGSRATGTYLGSDTAAYPVVVSGKAFIGESKVLGVPHYAVYQPMFNANGEIIGILSVAVEKAQITAVFNSVLMTFGLTILPVLGVVIFAGAFMTGRMLSPVRELASVTEQIALDNLTIDVPYTERTDEIAMLANSVTTLKQRSQERVRLAEQQEEADRAAFARQERVEALIAKFRTEVQALLNSVTETATGLDETAETLLNVAQNSASRAEETVHASDNATHNVQSVASAAEELNSSISEISRQVSQTNDIVIRATANTRETNQKVEGLAKSALKISEVISLIQAIAEQTNLLALNATIEAARAGEAGKGFAVVASEVKELANQTSKATEEISAQISSIQAATEQSVAAIGDITATIDEVNSYTTAIASAVEEQSAATAEISQNVQRAAMGTSSVGANMSELSEAVSRTNVSADTVQKSARTLSDKTDALTREVDRFLRDVSAA